MGSRARGSRQGRLLQAMTAGAYAAYVVHAPVLIAVTLALRDLELYPLFKPLLAALAGVPASFLLAHALRRLPLARNVLYTSSPSPNRPPSWQPAPHSRTPDRIFRVGPMFAAFSTDGRKS